MTGPNPPLAPRPAAPSPWELAAEAIAVRIRWFGLLVGFAVVNLTDRPADRLALLNAVLAVGAAYTLADTALSLRGRLLLGQCPLVVSLMEALFITLLCLCDAGPDSPFRYYYFLSLICCAVRHSSRVTYATGALHCASYALLSFFHPAGEQQALAAGLTTVMLAWVTWAANALATLLKRVGDHLGELNECLRRHHAELERRITERTAQLRQSQAHVLHQEKMAAFGLLAAGIAHEVGNPLTSVSSLVQLLQRHHADPYTQSRLALVSGQLKRIQATLRELTEFSRPGDGRRGRVSLGDALAEALNIAKYYKRTGGRIAPPRLPAALPPVVGVREQLVQVFLNLILNAIDATAGGGTVEVTVTVDPAAVEVCVRDGGCGVPPEQAGRLFEPYFTTKRHGTGLGLFVTRQLVAEHGGSVWFEPTPGGGTTFRVRLPAEAPPSDAPAAPAVPPALEVQPW